VLSLCLSYCREWRTLFNFANDFSRDKHGIQVWAIGWKGKSAEQCLTYTFLPDKKEKVSRKKSQAVLPVWVTAM
jgi:hypothetical protein